VKREAKKCNGKPGCWYKYLVEQPHVSDCVSPLGRPGETASSISKKPQPGKRTTQPPKKFPNPKKAQREREAPRQPPTRAVLPLSQKKTTKTSKGMKPASPVGSDLGLQKSWAPQNQHKPMLKYNSPRDLSKNGGGKKIKNPAISATTNFSPNCSKDPVNIRRPKPKIRETKFQKKDQRKVTSKSKKVP